MLLALGDGRALPASVLASEAGVAASTASEHLARLVDGNLLKVERHGRFRYYRLAGPEVGQLIETVAGLAPPARVRSLRDDTRAAAMRRARTCYDHLAGALGVELLRRLLASGVLTGHDGSFRPGIDQLSSRGKDPIYRLTDRGARELAALGVDVVSVSQSRRAVAHCVDWTEQCHHLSGALGATLTRRLFELRWLQRAERDRAVLITDIGAVGLKDTFGIVLPVLSSQPRS